MATYLAILPAGLNYNATFLRLPHPRTGIASLFLPANHSNDFSHNASRILEVQAVAPTEARSWFLEDEVISDGRLLLMTPVDPIFLLLPILQVTNPSDDGYEIPFRPADDIFEDAARKIEERCRQHDDPSYVIDARDILQFASFQCTKDSLQQVCDVKEVTLDITVYRFSESKVLDYLRRKVERLASPNVVEESKTLLRSLAKDGLLDDDNEKLLKVARIRAACELLDQYLPKNIGNALQASYDFGDLDVYLKGMRGEVIVSVDRKPKHGSTSTAKSQEEKKRKNKTSQGVEKLKKANVNGMAKLSSYFKKA
ncbi:hypothetical protein APHAL10511_003715 [Amanita phalloides]|nr:hypothetical protein APHAL10511_003715 [Amanita phalloides]